MKMIKPALRALLIQLMALLISLVLSQYFSLDVARFLLLQAVLALILSVRFGEAVWWRYIHVVFPILIGIFLYFQIASQYYLVGFLLSLGLFWTTYATQVPFYPSRSVVWRQVAELFPDHQSVRMIDIGSGMGDLCMAVALAKPKAEISGIEIAPIPWLISALRAYLKGSCAKFRLGNYERLNFADYDVVFAYLSPAAMMNLWQKAQADMRAGCLLISYEFDIPDVKPCRVIETTINDPPLYLYVIQR